MLFSAGVGSIIGVVLALIFMGLPLLYVGISTTSIWSRLPVLLQVPTLLVAAIVSVAVIVSLVATYFVLKRTLNLNIAEEIQYLE
jgi:ABC-type antimicrobial peptide transport system permease subunit